MSVIMSTSQFSGTVPATEGADAISHVTEPTRSLVGASSSDLFHLLESKPVWKIEELEEVLKISAKALYKQTKRGTIPSFRIGSCVRVPGKELADYLRSKMKKK